MGDAQGCCCIEDSEVGTIEPQWHDSVCGKGLRNTDVEKIDSFRISGCIHDAVFGVIMRRRGVLVEPSAVERAVGTHLEPFGRVRSGTLVNPSEPCAWGQLQKVWLQW